MDRNEESEEMDEGFDFQLPIQQHSRPISRMSGDLAINQNLLTVNLDETDIDENLMAVARNLGIEIPEEPQERKGDDSSPNISEVTVSSTIQDSSILHSRPSASTRPTSVDSDEEVTSGTPKPTHIPIHSLIPADIPLPLSTVPSRSASVAGSRAPSLAPSRTTSFSRAPSIAPSTVADSVTSTTRSVFSVSTISKHSSIASSFTKSLRRLSGFGKRKSTEPIEPISSQAQPAPRPQIGLHRGRAISTPQLERPKTSDGPPGHLMRTSSTLSAPLIKSSANQGPRRSVGTILPNYTDSRNGRGAARRPLTPTIEEEDLEELRIAQERSLRNAHLQKLRTGQLEEQAKFVLQHYERQRKVRDESNAKRQKAKDVYRKRRDETAAKHEVANAELEMRHLNAELELERILASQRKACETRLKYMEAYCNGKRDEDHANIPPDVKKYPIRRVTEEDYRKLVEQYHLKNGMETLHTSRINVLREQQAQQANRVSIRQDAELDGLTSRYQRESARLQSEGDRCETDLKREFTNKKLRMIWRWKVKEAIERRRLELERGQVFGELPDIIWPYEDKASDEKIMTALGEGHGSRLSFLLA